MATRWSETASANDYQTGLNNCRAAQHLLKQWYMTADEEAIADGDTDGKKCNFDFSISIGGCTFKMPAIIETEDDWYSVAFDALDNLEFYYWVKLNGYDKEQTAE
jgi:hypothetical protein